MTDLKQQEHQLIDIQEIINKLWNGKITIILVTSFFALSSIIYALSIPNEYSSTTLLAPAKNNSTQINNTGLGGLASLAGINIGESSNDEATLAYEIMQSWSFIEEFIEKNKLAVPLAAAEGWNKSTNELIINQSIYDSKKQMWVDKKPTSWKLFLIFLDKYNLEKEKSTGMVKLSIDFFSPQLTKEWIEIFVKEINDHMKKRKLNEIDKSILFLQEQIQKTSIGDLEDVFYRIIGEQTKIKMLAEASPEYAYITVNKAMIPEQKSKPIRSRMVILSTIFGGILSVIIIFLKPYILRLIENKNNGFPETNSIND